MSLICTQRRSGAIACSTINRPSSMHEHLATPHYPAIVKKVTHRGLTIEISTTREQQQTLYSAWVSYATGSAVAVPKAYSRTQAITRAKKWIERHFD